MLTRFKDWIGQVVGRRKNHHDSPLKEAIHDLLESESENGSAQTRTDELTLLSNVLEFRDMTVADVMIPRTEITGAALESTLPDLIEIVTCSYHSRIPVYRRTLDDVVGIVSVKDLLPYCMRESVFDLNKVLKEAQFVPPTMQLPELLLQMRSTGHYMMLVVDEFGGVDGLITLNDILEELVGEIAEKQELDAKPTMTAQADGSFIADARIPIEDCEEVLSLQLLVPLEEDGPIPDVDTLGGLLIAMSGHVPTVGEVLYHPQNLAFEVLHADLRRVHRVLIRAHTQDA